MSLLSLPLVVQSILIMYMYIYIYIYRYAYVFDAYVSFIVKNTHMHCMYTMYKSTLKHEIIMNDMKMDCTYIFHVEL